MGWCSVVCMATTYSPTAPTHRYGPAPHAVEVADLRRQHRRAPVIHFPQGIAASAAIATVEAAESPGARRYREYMEEVTGVAARRARGQV